MPIPLVTRILIADDHPIVRSGVRKVLDAKPDLEVVAEAEDGAEAVEKAVAEDVHLAILDVSMPRMTGIQAATELNKRKPELRLLMLSMYDSEQFDVLTPRELEVLKLIAEAYTSKEIAQQLFISVKTVERHRQNILDKLGMRDRVELTRYAIRRGLIQA